MTVNAYRYEMRLGEAPEAMVRVGVAVDMLRKNAHDSSRRMLCEAAVRAFRERASLAGYDVDEIEAEVGRFGDAVAKIATVSLIAA